MKTFSRDAPFEGIDPYLRPTCCGEIKMRKRMHRDGWFCPACSTTRQLRPIDEEWAPNLS